MKKAILLLALLTCILATGYSQSKATLSEELYITGLNDTIYVVTHNFPWPSNSLVVNCGKEVVLIDTPYEPLATELLVNWIKENLSPNKITAINTGFHIDNLGGNEVLRSMGIDIYGADLTVELVKSRSESTRKQTLEWLTAPSLKRFYDTYQSLVFVEPNMTYPIKKGLKLNVGGVEFEVYYPGESHSPDNVVVYIPKSGVLFGGCMIKSTDSKNLGFTGDANINEWPISVKKVKERFPNAAVVIPHHGLWGGKELIDHTLKLLQQPKP